CEVFGYDPLYMANEGKVVMVVPGDQAEAVLERMRRHPLWRDSALFGTVVEEHPGKVVLHTEIGGRRLLDMLAGEQLPRIC
ncbi:MAG: AIR synthase-related protein, partial [Cyclonatronaceae bacterium]